MRKIGVLLLLSLGITCFSEAQKIEESDLSFDFLKWHYLKYPGAEGNEWTKIKKDGQELVYVEFVYEDQVHAVTYKTNGHRLKERIKFGKKDLPNSAFKFLDEKFAGDKYKVDEFEQLNLFEGVKEVDSFYLMQVKVNKDQYILYFDGDLGHIKSPSPQLLSSL